MDKWKGKITARDVRDPGAGRGEMNFYYYNPEIGPEFIRRLFTEMEITLFRDFRQGHDWLATGKFALCLFCQPNMINQAKRQGLPVDSFPFVKESAGIVSRAGTLGLVKNAPHPNAARLWVDFVLSKESQDFLREQGRTSVRPDVGQPASTKNLNIVYVDPVSADNLTEETKLLRNIFSK